MGSDTSKANAASGHHANSNTTAKSDRPKSNGHAGQQANQSAAPVQKQMGDLSDATAGHDGATADRARDKPKS